MEETNKIECIKCFGNRGNYYYFDGDLYTETFPHDWVKSHEDYKTGPKYCISCRINGTWNGVFIGYCPECAEKYDGERGPGFIYARECTSQNNPDYSAFNTYLSGISLENIGDTDFLDSSNLFSFSHDSDDSDICELDIETSWCIDYSDDVLLDEYKFWSLPGSFSDEK